MRRELETRTWGKVVVELSRLCSYNGFGSFEVTPFKKLRLDLAQLADYYLYSGYTIKCRNNDVCCFNIGKAEVTLYKCGRMVLEQVNPNDFTRAPLLCMQVYEPKTSKSQGSISKEKISANSPH